MGKSHESLRDRSHPRVVPRRSVPDRVAPREQGRICTLHNSIDGPIVVRTNRVRRRRKQARARRPQREEIDNRCGAVSPRSTQMNAAPDHHARRWPCSGSACIRADAGGLHLECRSARTDSASRGRRWRRWICPGCIRIDEEESPSEVTPAEEPGSDAEDEDLEQQRCTDDPRG